MLSVAENTSAPTVADIDGNGRPDTCADTRFRRGDVDDDARRTVTDAIQILNYLFAGGRPPACLRAADVDNDGTVSLTDPLALLGYLFSAGEIAEPIECGVGGPSALSCDVGC